MQYLLRTVSENFTLKVTLMWKWKKSDILPKVKWNRNENLDFQWNWNESKTFVCESEMKVKKIFHTFSITILHIRTKLIFE